MNRYISVALIGCFLASVCYEWIMPDWNGYYLSKLLIIAALSGSLWLKLSYSELAVKSLAFIVFLDAVWNIGQWFANGAYQGSLELLNAFIFLPWLGYAWVHNLKSRDVLPMDGKLYKVTHCPTDLRGFFVALFADMFGGYGTLCNGKYYSFDHRVFTVSNECPENAIFIESEIEVTAELESMLKSKVGCRWTWRENCVTQWRELKRRYGG